VSGADLQRRLAKPGKHPIEGWPPRYTPIKVLGSGHDGLCYLATDAEHTGSENDKRVAIKVLKPKRRREITEPDIMRNLRHPNIVRLRRVHPLANNAICVVLDYCERGDLCDFVYQVNERDL
jgi:serine/threonine protein kinase